ncbi:MAG: delta-lactam-biosynthetic de-N-acetylase [Clostridia bacterium]|nr:delta-lactam-biosynthetic de-N-acetylase [Clostridia bacterium]
MKKLIFLLLLILSGCGAQHTKEYRPSPQISAPLQITASPTQIPASPKPSPTPKMLSYSNIDNTAQSWGLKKIKGSEPNIYESTKALLRKYNSYYIDEARPKALYLTFDEGYENGYTAKILDTLKKHNVPAAFFVTGPYLKTQQTLVRRMVDEGHIVGNHTVNHPNMAKLSPEKIEEELSNLNKSFKALCGSDMHYMRPPEGVFSERVLAVAKDLGYKTVFWSFAYKDWEANSQKDADYAYEQIVPYFHNGAIILLHAVSSANADALERVILAAKEQGYEFRSLDQLN